MPMYLAVTHVESELFFSQTQSHIEAIVSKRDTSLQVFLQQTYRNSSMVSMLRCICLLAPRKAQYWHVFTHQLAK